MIHNKHKQREKRGKKVYVDLTLESSVSISEAIFSNTCSSSKSGTSSALTCLALAFIPSLLNATNFASISFSKCLACFLRSVSNTKSHQSPLYVHTYKSNLTLLYIEHK